jgi:antitoxin YefM
VIGKMNAVSFSDLRQNLKTYLDKVFHDHEVLIVTRKNDENVVLISIDEYNSLIETNYLIGNTANAKHLAKSIAQYENGFVQEKELALND